MTKLVLTGSIAIDRIMNFDGKFEDVIQADKLHVLSLSVLLKEVVDTPGGVAANIAYSLVLLGDQPILLGSVGKNAQGYIDRLTSLGVDTSRVHYSELPTASFTVMTDKNHCQVGGFYPGAMADGALLSLVEYKDEDALMVISPHDPVIMAKQVKECQNLNLRLFYDIGQQVSNVSSSDLKEGLSAAELIILNDYEMGVLERRTALSQEEITKSLQVLVITLGEKGCFIFDNRGEQMQKYTVEAEQGVKVVDPTGAGDAFRSGFLYGYVRNWELEKCAKLGAKVAKYAIESKGTQEHQFKAEDLLE